MGGVATPQMDAEVQAAGEDYMRQLAVLYQRYGWIPVPGREMAMLVDGCAQALFSAYIHGGHDPDDAVDAMAHCFAIVFYQQDDLEVAWADLRRRVDAFGIEFTQDTAKGRA